MAVYGLWAARMSMYRRIDFDAQDLRDSFHFGEREERKHFRWTKLDVHLLPRFSADIGGAVCLRFTYKAATLREPRT